jgi:hypothetical protein
MKLFSKKQSDAPRRRSATDNDIRMPSSSSNIFKRNQTLVGKALKYNHLSVGVDVGSPRAHIHHLTAKRRKVFSIFIVVVVSAASLWILISHFTAMIVISSADTTISKPINDSIYIKTIQDYFEINPLSRFQFFLDQNALSTYVANKLPEVEVITEKNMVGIGATSFAIAMRTPIAGWKINDKQYYVDAKGVPFEQNYFTTPIVQIVDNSGASLQTGEASVSKRFLGFVGLIVSLASNNGFIVTQALLPANTTRELDIVLKDTNILVKLSIDRPAGEQIEDMTRSVGYFTSRGQIPTYIDVRVSGKAFYK